ncbi:TetR/AcrR family transcriptional regulator [Streptomyces omiyaensis]|uniref:TetR/AcrR family transcriptional regulator n=1 Tax=Streptomyces omiyaensis TaxID=68247 RepID=A0ABW7BTI8_9ACTN|nr:TetR/AcrR family transcriptional regulator [Streptomyces omiyaensis]GGY33522.1 TetR family transcriptional regulator [Streptomyces omiyaensis]
MPEKKVTATAKTAGRGSYAVGEARRRLILDTAVDHFGKWGFHASSLARIAHDCGITQGGLLHHFRSKEDLLLSVLAQSEEHDVARLLGVEQETYAAYLDALVELIEENTRRPGIVRMFNVLVGESGNVGHPAHEYFRRRYARVLAHGVERLEDAVRRGELRPDVDCPAVAREYLAVMDGLQIQWALDPDSLDMPARVRDFLRRQYEAIRATEGGTPAGGRAAPFPAGPA